MPAGERFIYVSGQVALDESGALVGKGDADTQAEQVFKNIHRILMSCGAGIGDIQIDVYFMVGLNGQELGVRLPLDQLLLRHRQRTCLGIRIDACANATQEFACPQSSPAPVDAPPGAATFQPDPPGSAFSAWMGLAEAGPAVANAASAAAAIHAARVTPCLNAPPSRWFRSTPRARSRQQPPTPLTSPLLSSAPALEWNAYPEQK